jgi:hypothetical protein
LDHFCGIAEAFDQDWQGAGVCHVAQGARSGFAGEGLVTGGEDIANLVEDWSRSEVPVLV